MTKTYGLKAIRALIPMAAEASPLLASYTPFGDDAEPWIARYIVGSKGFWLQKNDRYGHGYGNQPPPSTGEVEAMTGLNPDDLEAISLDGVGYCWGLPGGSPLLPLPFTAKQFIDFDTRSGKLFSGAMERPVWQPLPESECENATDDSEPEGRDFQAEWIAELEATNPDAAELARIILSGVVPESDSLDSAMQDATNETEKVTGATVDQTPDAERRLNLLRQLGGSSQYVNGEWKFKGIKLLVTREKADGRNRSDEKTIRSDLKAAAQAERDAKNAGFAFGLGQR